MGDISLADVARALDAMLDDQMTGQARIAAHLAAAAETAGQDAERVIETLTGVVSTTALDECWITDGEGFAYITTVRDANGAPVPFRFSPDPAVQPQASAFHTLLSSDPESDDVVAQGAQVREIDNEVFKYVGVAGVDSRRIVQVGNALAFEEQALQSGVYTSPVMTAVLAAFSEPDLLANARTSDYAGIRSVFEGLLGQQMIVQATLAGCFVAAAEAAGWTTEEIDGRLRRIVRSSAIGEVHVASRTGDVLYTGLPSRPAGGAADLPHAAELGLLGDVATRVIEHPTVARAADNAFWKHVTVADASRFSQVGIPISDSSPVSRRFGGASAV